MDLLTLFLLAVGLSMDAFAVSICKGLAMKKLTVKQAVIVGAWFGGFQALMPTLGYLLGTTFARFVNAVSDWITFVLLALIGANMIKEALSKEEEEEADASLGVKEMFVLAVATSIDAFAVGVSFACMEIGSMIVPAVLFIGVITFSLSAAGVKVGNVFGTKYKAKAELAGGIILILLGVITLRIPAAYLITFAVFMLIFGKEPMNANYLVAELCGGGLMLGAFFMATDYVTSPITPAGQIIYGICCGLLTGIFRCFGANAEGVSFAIILSNILVPIIEKFTIPRAFGLAKEAKKNE